MNTALSIEQVSHWYGDRQVLFDISLDVHRGSITAVIGPSGQGKTTLLRIIGGFEVPRKGVVRIGERVVNEHGKCVIASERRGVSIVPQEGALFPHLSVGGNVAFGLSQRRGVQAKQRVAEVLEIVGLAGMQKMRPHQLSGGMQQRVALARALAPHPELILLDEPFAALDMNLRESVRDETIRTLRAEGATVLWVTHDQEEALANSDQVAVLLEGRIRQVAAPSDLYAHPSDKQTAEFVGDVVVLKGNTSSNASTVKCALGDLALSETASTDGEVHVVVRPEQMQVSSSATSNSVSGEVVATKFFGHDGLVHARLASAEIVIVRVQADALPVVGSRVNISVRGPVRAYTR
jgi:iron(III) transport system ATP-binding protein